MNRTISQMNESDSEGRAEQKPKQPYTPPELLHYGSITDLTQFGGSGSSDFLGMQEGMGM